MKDTLTPQQRYALSHPMRAGTATLSSEAIRLLPLGWKVGLSANY